MTKAKARASAAPAPEPTPAVPVKMGRPPAPTVAPSLEGMADDALVRIGEVALLLRVSPTTVRRFIRNGIIPKPQRMSSTLVGWKAKDVRGFMRSMLK